MKKIYKRIIIAAVMIYFASVLFSQQEILNTYKAAETNYKQQLEEANATKETLIATKQNVSSPEYIEEIAREKLDMYLPNERVYIDIEK